MNPGDISKYIEKLKLRFSELEKALSDPSVYSRPNECKSLSRERQSIDGLFRNYDEWIKSSIQIEENKKLLASEKDPDLISLIQSDISSLESKKSELEKKIKIALVPADPNDSKNIIVEIRPAAGGEEAALFAGEMFRLYSKYAESRKWKFEALDLTESELGGIREAVFSLSGSDVFSRMKYESGVHRVQRIPATETGGRIHTSTITVAVFPEAEEVELEIRPHDLKFDFFRSSGPGGQNVNRTDSACRVTHIPTGLSVACQQEKSQHRNRETALRILRARLLEIKQQEELAKQSASKKAQIGTGDRSERIRTYNFPQNRVTDHRFGVSIHNLPRLLEGELDMLLDNIISIDSENRLNSLNV